MPDYDKSYEWYQEAGKGEETDSLLKSPEQNTVLPTP